MYIHTYTYVYTHICIYTHMYIHTYTHIYTHIHIGGRGVSSLYIYTCIETYMGHVTYMGHIYIYIGGRGGARARKQGATAPSKCLYVYFTTKDILYFTTKDIYVFSIRTLLLYVPGATAPNKRR